MSMPTSIDWLWHTIAVIVGLLGLWLFYRSFLKDRPHGRRRCPKCWYDLSGNPVSRTCSECGYVARRERTLHKTRRHWRWGLLSVIVIIAAATLSKVPRARRDGWQTVTPSTILVLAAPFFENPPSGAIALIAPSLVVGTGPPFVPKPTWRERLFLELHNRIASDRLASWQLRLLSWRCGLASQWSVKLVTRDAWLPDQAVCVAPLIDCHLNSKASPWLILSGQIRFKIHPRIAGAPDVFYRPYTSLKSSDMWQQTDPWQDRLCLYRVLPADVRSVKFDLYVEWNPTKASWDAWRTLAHESLLVKFERNVSSPPTLASVDTLRLRQLVAQAVVEVKSDGILMRWTKSEDPRDASLPTLPIHFQLLRDGRPIAETRAWWTSERPGESATAGPIAMANSYRVSWDNPRAADVIGGSDTAAAPPEWVLRLSGEAAQAIIDVRSTHFWSGTVDVPLQYHSQLHRWTPAPNPVLAR